MATRKRTTARRPAPKLDAASIAEELGIETPIAVVEPKGRKTAEPGPATQKVYDRIKELREQGLGIPTITKTLNAEKIPTLRGGETWHNAVVHNIIRRHGFEKGGK